MRTHVISAWAMAAALGTGSLMPLDVARGAELFEMMNPLWWMFGDDDDDYWDYPYWDPYYSYGPYANAWGYNQGYGQNQTKVIVLPAPEESESSQSELPLPE